MPQKTVKAFAGVGLMMIAVPMTAMAQSSSLYLQQSPTISPNEPAAIRRESALSAAIGALSFVAVGSPVPRKFTKYDLVTIIVRETITDKAESRLRENKDLQKSAKLSALPKFRLQDLLQLQLNQSDLNNREPEIDLKVTDSFEGRGRWNQTNTFTARITARIIDIKPNGTLVLEARKTIKTDGDAFVMIVTGTCRKEDISTGNTVLSEQIYDLTVVKKHTGEMRKTAKKGWLTQLFDVVFNF